MNQKKIDEKYFYFLTQPFFILYHLSHTCIKKFVFMRSFRHILVSLSQQPWLNFDSKSAFFVLVVAFILLLIATENIIKQTFIPL